MQGVNQTHNGTEYFDKTTQSMIPGPILPYVHGLSQHCMTWKDSDTILILGGVEIYEDRTNTRVKFMYEFNTVNEAFTPLPELRINMMEGGCTVITTAAGEKELIAFPGKN